jgi:hypothetical protein
MKIISEQKNKVLLIVNDRANIKCLFYLLCIFITIMDLYIMYLSIELSIKTLIQKDLKIRQKFKDSFHTKLIVLDTYVKFSK